MVSDLQQAQAVVKTNLSQKEREITHL